MIVAPLRLLRLPFIVQKEIFAQIDFWNRIHLTMQSTRIRRLMELFKINVDSLTFTIESDEFRMTVQDNSTPIPLQLIITSDTELPKTWKIDNIKVGVCHGPIRNSERTIYVECGKEEEEDMMELVTKSLFKMLKVKKFHLKIEDDFKNCFIWNYIPQFESIDYKESKYAPCLPVQLPLAAFNVKNLTFTVENSHPSWISQKTLQKHEEEIRFKPIKSAYELIYQWRIGHYEQLETLVVKHSHGYVPYDRTSKMLTIRRPAVSDATLISHFPGIRRAGDILRETDGLRATVAIGDNELRLIVWTEQRLKATTTDT